MPVVILDITARRFLFLSLQAMTAAPEVAGARFMPVNDKGKEVVVVEKRL
jgi:hypothetical protein